MRAPPSKSPGGSGGLPERETGLGRCWGGCKKGGGEAVEERLYGPESVSIARDRWGGGKCFSGKKLALYILFLFVDEKKFFLWARKKEKSVVVFW